MKVFISWSGERSKQVAELLDNWIQCVIQAVDPWMSSKDIDRGALWFTEISDQLSNTNIGIICLTKENKNKPWILFEAGALAKGLTSNRICTFLIDLLPTDLENPLAQFNHTSPTKLGIWELVRTINLSLKDKALKESILSRVFDTYWDQFNNDFKKILESTSETEIVTKRDDTDIMLEMLSTIRTLDKRLRNMESERESSVSIREIPSKRNLSSSSLRNEILRLMEQGLSEEAILEILSEKYNLSRRIVIMEMSQVQKSIERTENNVEK